METDTDFDRKLDAYQARLAYEADDALDRSYVVAARPGAVRAEVTFGDLVAGDYMTNEPPGGRWVRVVEVRRAFSYVKRREQGLADDFVSVLFEVPESVVVSGETRYWVDRRADETVVVDAAERGTGFQPVEEAAA